MRAGLALLMLAAACGPVPSLQDSTQLAAQANMMRLEGTSVANPFAATFTSCVLSAATQAEAAALAVAQSQAEMDAMIAPIVTRPAYQTCMGPGFGGGGA